MLMRDDRSSERRKGFSLVEVLVAVVILGVLAGILSPGLGSSTGKAEASRIISDIRTLKAASLMYRLDHGGFDGTEDINVLVPYADGTTINGTDLTYSFVIIHGSVFLRVDLSRIKEDVRKKIAEMAEGEFMETQVLSGWILREMGAGACSFARKVLSFWDATPAYAGNNSRGNRNGNGNGNNHNDHSGNGNDNNGNGNSGNNGNGHGNGNGNSESNHLGGEDPGPEVPMENPDDGSEGSFPVTDQGEDGEEGDQGSEMGEDEGSLVEDLQPYSGGEVLLLRI